MGAVTCLGSSVQQLWEGLLTCRSGIRRITQFDPIEVPCKIAGEIPDFDPELYMDRKEVRRNPRVSQITLAAAIQAVKDAGLHEPLDNPERSAVVFGTALGGLDRLDDGITTMRAFGANKVGPFTIPTGIPNYSAFLIARHFSCLGPNCTIVTACATGTQVIGEAAEVIRRGKADIVIAGGAEALIKDYSIMGFAVMKALPVHYNDDPTRASRPFDANREGFIISEGSGVVVLESLQHAEARGARIYAEVCGAASSSDAFHMAAPDPEAAGPIRAMRWALQDAGISPDEVDYINAHGTSTPLNDENETRAIKAVFGERAYQIPISSTKSMIGHAMGASGALEAIVCALTINESKIHPTINYEIPDPACDLDYVPNHARQQQVNVTLSNSFGLGGQNACLILKKYQDK
jgi:beta-ketoacyl-acyl-carrier-protein synthase II